MFVPDMSIQVLTIVEGLATARESAGICFGARIACSAPFAHKGLQAVKIGPYGSHLEQKACTSRVCVHMQA